MPVLGRMQSCAGAYAAAAAQACSCLSELILTHTSVSNGSFLTALASSCTRLTLLRRHHLTISAAAEATLEELATSLPELLALEFVATSAGPLALHPQLLRRITRISQGNMGWMPAL